MGYVYYFENADKEIIYVGRTNNIDTRMNQHFGSNGHLSKQCYDETIEVYYAEVNSLNESRIYELYLIGKLKPKYNTVFSDGGLVTFDLPDLEFKLYHRHDTTINNELIYEYISSEIECIRSSSISLKVCCTIDVDNLSKRSKLSPSDYKWIEGRDRAMKINIDYILQSLERIEKTLGINKSTSVEQEYKEVS